jgi:hypothetical protein
MEFHQLFNRIFKNTSYCDLEVQLSCLGHVTPVTNDGYPLTNFVQICKISKHYDLAIITDIAPNNLKEILHWLSKE